MTDRESKDLDLLYGERFPVSDPAHARWRRELWQVLVDDFFSRWIQRDARVLDFGSGNGEFINVVRAHQRIAVDLRGGAKAYLDEGVEFRLTNGTEIRDTPDGSVDVVFCSNPLEHLPTREALLALFAEFRRVLTQDGRLLILGPNLLYTGQAYWDFFDHILPITHPSLAEALSGAGFAVDRLIPRFLPYTTVGARKTPIALVRLYLRVPLAWRVMGAQFFAVARPAESVRRADG
ncbi:MAG: class I SAM-dependent methyltransferase [Myxococcota bacterium]